MKARCMDLARLPLRSVSGVVGMILDGYGAGRGARGISVVPRPIAGTRIVSGVGMRSGSREKYVRL
jgi:hypothetical protein